MKKSNFALRLQPSLIEEARKIAKAEGVAVNQLINVAVVEKMSPLRTRSTSRNVPRGATSPRPSAFSSEPGLVPHRSPTTSCRRSGAGRGSFCVRGCSRV